MNTSAPSIWLSNLEINEDNLFAEESYLKWLDVDDEKFLSHDIAGVFQEQPLTSESTSTTLRNSFTDETSFDYFERPTKLLKTIDFTEKNSPQQLSPSSPSTISPFHSQILSFDNPKQNEIVLPQMGNSLLSTPKPKGSSKNQNLETETETKTKTSKGTRRSPAHAQEHIMAERKRRERLSQSFIALAALVPGLKKMDKVSVLADAIKYVKELKERLGVLEEESQKTKPELICSDEDSSTTCDESNNVNESVFEVEARVSKQEIMIRIQCQKHKGLLVKMMSEIQSLHLFAVNSSVLPFGNSILDITIIAHMGEGYSLSIEELVKKLRMAGLKFMA